MGVVFVERVQSSGKQAIPFIEWAFIWLVVEKKRREFQDVFIISSALGL